MRAIEKRAGRLHVVDALSTGRPYRKAMAPEDVRRTMEEEAAKGWLFKALVDEFMALVDRRKGQAFT